MAIIDPETMQSGRTVEPAANPVGIYALNPPTMQPADLNPPPTEGLLWPRFDYLIPE
jgi:hypothetical protein